MRFIINIVCFLFLLPLIATAQTYKYIGVENGLSNRRIFDIQKDSIGYMWFLTNEGIDRYNGKDIKHYKLIEENKESSFPIHLGWLYFEEKGKLWVIGKAGRIFQYNQEHDVFNRVYKLPKTPVNISYGYMDCNHRIWLCSRYSIALYDTQTGEVHQMSNELKSSITSIEQVDNNHFFMGTDKGLRYVKLENETLQIVPLEPLDKIQAQISSLYFHQESQRLFIGTFEKGVFAYDIRQQRIIHSNTDLSDVNIARIKPLNQTELLIATEGMGIHKINMNSCISEPYIVSSYKSHNEMNSNNINDIYIDEEKRIWIANYPEGITIIDNRYKSYNWIKHSIGNRQSLVNDQVHSVIEDSDGDLWFGTSNGISCFHPTEKTFHNWTKEQGLMSSCFSASSGTLRKNKGFVFGSTDGAIEFPEGTRLPKYIYSPMILSDFQILYQTVFPGSPNSPLKENINQTDRLKLKYNQNTFSLSISSINYDAPDNVTFYWKLEGFYDDWNRLGEEGHLRFTNLASGDYKLYIRAVSKEEPYLYFEERSIDISIARPVWFSFWAIACYVLLTVLMSVVGFRVMALRKQKKISDEKTRFFVNTAHDIRTPLTLIKAPLEEMLENKTLNEAETNNMHMALRNVNSLLRMTTNLINFERAEVYSPHLYIAEYELNTYIKEIYNNFQTYATIKHITFRYESNFSYMNVWFDKEKMDSILENVISNALKYTPQNGDILISVYDMKSSWRLEVKDNGIGIPAKEQRKLFKMHFRGTNAINSKITGSGIGLMLVRKLVSLHNGKIYIESTECQGSTVRIILPKEKEQFKNFTLSVKDKKTFYEPDVPTVPLKLAGELRTEDNDKLHRILIVEDNDELRNYLFQSFSPIYNVQVCNNGKEALTIVKQFWPGLILSDIMMPEMRGDELCIAIKNDIETSHIPVVLLTALGDEKNILEGLHIGADEYIVKPFSINILKASIANLLANRALLRKRYADLEINTEEEPSTTTTCSNSLDWKFMSNVKRHIEENMDNPDFTVDVLCSLLNMSRTSFYSKLKALTGQAPADFVRNIRLKHAAELLKEGKYSVTEVAERTGFCDGKYFREVFKKYFNVSPSQYAKGDTPRSPKGEGE